MHALKALLLSDGKPGHYRLAEGILKALNRKRELTTTRVEVRRRALVPARAVSHLINAGMSPARILAIAYGLNVNDLPPCDLVVSAGGNTLGANIAAARILNASNIFYGSLRRFHAADFTLVLTSYARQVHAPNQLMTLKPSALDPDTFPPNANPPSNKSRPDQEPSVAGLILGGNSGTVKFDNADWQTLLAFVASCHDRYGIRWIVSNSPRTPTNISDELAARAASNSQSVIQSFIDVREPNAPSLEALLGTAEPIVCTADSSTMLSECVWARKPVVAVSPAKFSLPDNERAYRNWLKKQNWAHETQISNLTPQAFSQAINTLRPMTTNPLDRLADELQKRLPTIFD